VNRLRRFALTAICTLFRLLPFRFRTGLIRIGSPDRDAPVFLTGNFRLTVERVRHVLEGVDGLDAWLLVANSGGVNVWCAASGGMLTNHGVVSVLKTSGIGALVDHRRVILPQLAATGVEGREVLVKTGWHVVWGPVDARAIPAFLDNDLRKSREMKTVRFPWPQRVEMAVAWAFPISAVFALLALLFWPGGILKLASLVWGWSFVIFLGFPLYERRLRDASKDVGRALFDLGGRGVALTLWIVFSAALALYTALAGALWGEFLRWSLASLVVVLTLEIDLAGSTPVYKSGFREDRMFRIVLDEVRCRGAGLCEQVCPTDVFEVDPTRHLASMPRSDQCVQCGACIVQCPYDALSFESPAGTVVGPDTVRRFKLNLLGRRQKASS
jgi:NAD-dependent dihydropyrimidine dehydrogenase PreA subunit